MPKAKRFAVYESIHDDVANISIVFDEDIIYLTSTAGGPVTIQRAGNVVSRHENDIHHVASELCGEFFENGRLNAETIELDKTSIPIPKSLLKIHCNKFLATFLGGQRAIAWLELIEGHVEVLNICETYDVIGLGNLEQISRVGKQLILCSSDVTDENLQNLSSKLETLVLNSPTITENGVKILLPNWLEQYSKTGNVFEIRFKASSTNFEKMEMFENLKNAEITWQREYEYQMKYTQKTGQTWNFNGYYFITGDWHLLKIWT
ncbi:FBA_2 domain-containing protein [Caenorhabditis elegans]|uniref:FBA_2 domain-containing protein n=1 Tax=Caenorhabditis elegans TaxID=6239 RepID=Q4W5R0_CAEEL|nr:FBA_2 domain-containing protein [Caenorhabditis elegans]CCD67983.2 FBA_2 domain-containing protein [Caenorhabditis elegans]|eukprot:NP_001021825.2 Uncharacterized protein CELE_Y71G12B.32 [Caenorhabditis elegans]